MRRGMTPRHNGPFARCLMSFGRSCSLALIIVAVSTAQRQPALGRPANIRVDSDLLLINALVTNRKGAAVPGLSTSKVIDG